MLYVHLCWCHTINHWSISFIICCRKKPIFHTNLGNPACNAIFDLDHLLLHPLRFPATMHSASSPWMPGKAEINAVEITPFMATACQIHKHAKHIKKHPLFSKDMETTWKKTQLCYFSDYLHFTLWNCPWYLYQHSALSMSRSWVTIPYRLIPNRPMPPTIDRERCFLLTASSLTATSTYELFDEVGLGPPLFWFCLNHFIMMSFCHFDGLFAS